jgi:catalase
MSKTQEPTMSKTKRFTNATGAPVADNTNIMTADLYLANRSGS